MCDLKKGEFFMINFIIYEDNKKWQEHYKKAILNVIGHKEDKFQIITFDKYTKETKKKIESLIGKNIFLLDMEVPGKSGLDLAREIRNTGDWVSQMIMITSHNCFKEEGFTSKVLMLDFIDKSEDLEENIRSAIVVALRIHSHYKSFHFMYDNELYQIPYQDILYFEKELNNNYTSIFTKTDKYKIKQSIKNLECELKTAPCFFKTHQSCIVNLQNITHVDFPNNTITFPNHTIQLLARNKKKELKEKIEKGYLYDIT